MIVIHGRIRGNGNRVTTQLCDTHDCNARMMAYDLDSICSYQTQLTLAESYKVAAEWTGSVC